jgi:hypothetical protein
MGLTTANDGHVGRWIDRPSSLAGSRETAMERARQWQSAPGAQDGHTDLLFLGSEFVET